MPHNNNTTANNNNNGGGSGKAWKTAKQTGLYISGAGALVGGAVALGFSMLEAAKTLKGISRASDEIDQKLSDFESEMKKRDGIIKDYFSQKKQYEQQLTEEIQKISADASSQLNEKMDETLRRFTEELRKTMADNSLKNTEAIDRIREVFAEEIQRIREEDNDRFDQAVEQIQETNRKEWEARNETWKHYYADQFRKMSEIEAKMAEHARHPHGPTYGEGDHTKEADRIVEMARDTTNSIREAIRSNDRMRADELQSGPPPGYASFDPEEPRSYHAAAYHNNSAGEPQDRGNEEADDDDQTSSIRARELLNARSKLKKRQESDP